MLIAHFSTALKTTENHAELTEVCTLLLNWWETLIPNAVTVISFLLSWQRKVKIER